MNLKLQLICKCWYQCSVLLHGREHFVMYCVDECCQINDLMLMCGIWDWWHFVLSLCIRSREWFVHFHVLIVDCHATLKIIHSWRCLKKSIWLDKSSCESLRHQRFSHMRLCMENLYFGIYDFTGLVTVDRWQCNWDSTMIIGVGPKEIKMQNHLS